MANSQHSIPAPAQQPGLRAYIVYNELPAGCIAFEVPDDGAKPLLRAGEFVVIDMDDRDPAEGELFAVTWKSNIHQKWQIVRMDLRAGRYGKNGVFRDDWLWFIGAPAPQRMMSLAGRSVSRCAGSMVPMTTITAARSPMGRSSASSNPTSACNLRRSTDMSAITCRRAFIGAAVIAPALIAECAKPARAATVSSSDWETVLAVYRAADRASEIFEQDIATRAAEPDRLRDAFGLAELEDRSNHFNVTPCAALRVLEGIRPNNLDEFAEKLAILHRRERLDDQDVQAAIVEDAQHLARLGSH